MRNDQTAVAGTASGQFNGISPSRVSQPKAAWASRWGIIAALQVVEILVIVGNIYFWLSSTQSTESGKFRVAMSLAFGFTVAALVHLNLRYLCAYDFADLLSVWRSGRTAAIAWLIATGALVVIAIMTETASFSRTIVTGWSTGLLGIVSVRLVTAGIGNAFVRLGWLKHNTIIIGSGLEARHCADSLGNDRRGTHVVGLVTISYKLPLSHHERINAGEISDLQQLILLNKVKDVVISGAFEDREELADLIKALLWLPVRVYLWLPDLGVPQDVLAADTKRVIGRSLLLVGVPPLDGWHWVIKDMRDRLLATLLLLLIAPVMIGIALLIKLTSPGPILFKQLREGYGGSSFMILKFRTMRVTVDPTSHLTLTTPNDPRVFRIGALLRKTSLDELPQLLNVVRGDMWLIGPRPHSRLATAAGQRYSAAIYGYIARLRVKPGITGWAQVNGWRGPTDTLEQIQQRFNYDQQYIQRQSFWFDLQILLRTAIKGFVHMNAY